MGHPLQDAATPPARHPGAVRHGAAGGGRCAGSAGYACSARVPPDRTRFLPIGTSRHGSPGAHIDIPLTYRQAVYESWSFPHFTEVHALIGELFPANGHDASAHLFHRGLSDAEKQQLVAARDGWRALLKIWVRNSKAKYRAGCAAFFALCSRLLVHRLVRLSHRLEADDFRAVCLPSFEEKELVALTLQYLAQLEGAVERVNGILNAP